MESTLSPPKPPRSRAHSSTLCSPITLASLGRRRSNSCLTANIDNEQCPESHTPPTVLDQQQQPATSTMTDWLVSGFLRWLHFPQKHSFSWSTPSSPRSSTDESILPLSASATTLTFSVPDPKELQKLNSWRFRLSPAHAPIFAVILLLPISTAFVLWSLSTLPISMSWPHTISDLAQICRELHGYSQSGPGPLVHVVSVMAISAVWKHAWSIPGSVLWNVLAGALFSPFYATILLTTLTTMGSACATLLSKPLGPFLSSLSPRALEMTRHALGGESDLDNSGNQSSMTKSSAWVRLSILRLIGVVPWSGINIACGVCNVPLADCMLGTFIGCLPWTAVTCQIGDILQQVASTPSPTPQSIQSLLTTPDIAFKLVFLSVISLAPILGRSRLSAILSSQPTDDERKPRWVWVQEWRTKIRLPSRSRQREQGRKQDQLTLDTLVSEKRRFEDSEYLS
ncbi:snare associated Golgi protein-domain-containing protein [Crepidotus variabilis]|uniref:Snare associated Golgi protein-domain-containing protein n=1 Tax=Crepidotus variabilis TaxID=179855 RepID=A0A9P6ESC1_9AGAR|nr:snare associated Golgi protein-domain-containing protein [Crepidotus variabilis]